MQRDTVKNERGQRVDNAPYGLLGERVGEALFPEGHPYSWSVIGYVEDLDRVDVDDLKAFFLRWYGPNNAVLTIGGDFDEADTLGWVRKYFGPIPRGPDVAVPEKPAVTLDADRYISLEDNVALPLLQIAFPTVYRFHPDEAPLDVLMYVLGVRETSLLYQNMVSNRLAVQAQASHGCRELSCTFAVIALPNPADPRRPRAHRPRLAPRARDPRGDRGRRRAGQDEHRLADDLRARERVRQGGPARELPDHDGPAQLHP